MSSTSTSLSLSLSLSQVKVLYVRNLMLATTEGLIEEAFATHAPVERVKKIKDYAFVHFTSKEDAQLSMEKMNGKSICVYVFEALTIYTHTHTHTH